MIIKKLRVLCAPFGGAQDRFSVVKEINSQLRDMVEHCIHKVPSRPRLSDYWQCPNSNTLALKYDETPLLQRRGHLSQVIKKQAALL